MSKRSNKGLNVLLGSRQKIPSPGINHLVGVDRDTTLVLLFCPSGFS